MRLTESEREALATALPELIIGPESRLATAVERIVAERLAELDDPLCDALMAARHGKYDGCTAATHLEQLVKRLRTWTDA